MKQIDLFDLKIKPNLILNKKIYVKLYNNIEFNIFDCTICNLQHLMDIL